MNPAAEHALADLALIRADHENAHRCPETWYNPHVTGGRYCPTWNRVQHAITQVETLHLAAADAADQPAACTAVAEAMTGLVMAELDVDSREGWERTARDAMRATHLWITTDHAPSPIQVTCPGCGADPEQECDHG